MIKKSLIKIVASTVLGFMAFSGSAMSADAYPTSPVKIIVPFAAGGGADNTLRAFVPELEKRLNQTIVVSNLPSGAGILGGVTVKESKPDGYTLGMSTGTTFGVNQMYTAKMPYDAESDYEYIAVIGESQRAVFASGAGTIKTHEDLVRQSKTDTFNMGAGVKSNDLMNAELWKNSVGSKTKVITYGAAGTPAQILDLVSGRIDAIWNNVPSMASCLQNNSCVPIAVTGRSRLPEYPNVPTFRELGFTNIDAPSYFGIYAPKGTPKEVLVKLNAAINDVLGQPEVKAKLKKLGLVALQVDLAEARRTHLDAIKLGKKAGELMGVTPQ